MKASLRVLMEGLIDYAGLFPPASLGMEEAVRNFAEYRKSPQADWLGRFVVPAARLDEFAQVRQAVSGDEAAWPVSALMGPDFAADAEIIRSLHQGPAGRLAQVDTVEFKAETAEALSSALAQVPAGILSYAEIPLAEDPTPLLKAIAAAGARAKIRTGGVAGNLIPPSMQVARFLKACARAGVPFKATAGLHHPIRSLRQLTYAKDSPYAVMHGFINVFLAAAFAAKGMEESDLAALLNEEEGSAFRFGDGEIEWRGSRLPASTLMAVRRDFAVSFGSCSFEEPREDLREEALL
jgi:hypothetical protein